ncbi:MAG TPA: DHA2 family efflux MFS transporter permease subunit [Pseudonocardia sp.]|nr:DHA2 family efflux MFS transporter permease subunit [Pseudonocardia sp.]
MNVRLDTPANPTLADLRNPVDERIAAAPVPTSAVSTTAVRTATVPTASRPTEPGPVAAPAPAPTDQTHWLVPIAVAVVGMFLSVLDSSIIGIALPVIGKDFYVNNDDLSWVNTAFRVSEAMVVPATAWLASRLGLRRMYLIALVLFAAFSLLTSLAWDLNSLVAFRILQAIPGSMTPVVSLAIIFRLVPAAKRGLGLSLYGLGIVAAPGLAPLIGGLLVQNGAWRTVFYVDAPLALIGLAAAVRVLPQMPGSSGRRFDVLGWLTAGFGLSALTAAIAQGSRWGWTSYPVLMLATFGALSLALFVVIELEVEQPLLELRTFTRRPFLALTVLIDIMFTGVTAVLLFLPSFLARAQQLSPTDIGLFLLPQALLWMAMMPVAGLIYARFGSRWPAAIGMALTGLGTLGLAGITVDTPRPELIAWLVLRSFGLGLTVVPILAGGMSSLPPALINDGSALRTVAQRITAGMGLALLSAMQLNQQTQDYTDRIGLMQIDSNPDLTHLAHGGARTVLGLWRQVSLQAATDTYANAFVVAGTLSLVGALLAAWLLPTGNPTAGRR